MAYKHNKFIIPGGGVLIPWTILNSPAYKDLKQAAPKALPFFLGKVKCGNKTGIKYDSSEYYNIVFKFCYKEAERYGFAPSTFSGVIKKLVEKGFIDPVTRGGMKGAGLGYSWFKLSSRWKNYKTQNFVEVKWETQTPKPRTKKSRCTSPFLPPPDYFPTSQSEIDRFNLRNNDAQFKPPISENRAVGGGTA